MPVHLALMPAVMRTQVNTSIEDWPKEARVQSPRLYFNCSALLMFCGQVRVTLEGPETQQPAVCARVCVFVCTLTWMSACLFAVGLHFVPCILRTGTVALSELTCACMHAHACMP